MPKAKRRKRGAQPQSVPSPSVSIDKNVRTGNGGMRPMQVRRQSFGIQSSQGLFMAGLVALGCWGLAISFTFFTTDANRYLFGGMAALMGLMWSFMFVMRVRKIMHQK